MNFRTFANRRSLHRALSSAFVLAVAAAFTLPAVRSTSAAAVSSADWPYYNHQLDGQRFSQLDQITAANAPSLHRVCSKTLMERGALQSSPLIISGKLYVTTTHDTYALDAHTCAMLWRNQHVPKEAEPFSTDRGAVLIDGRLIRGHTDGHLTAIDPKTGKTVWDVAPAHGARGEFLSSAPIAWNHTVYIGTAGSDWGVKGRMMAFDPATGALKWTFTTIATGNDANAKTWSSVRASDTGGGGMWTSYALDPSTGELFVPVANPAPDFASAYRPGTNLYTDSIVVLDARTGKLKWYYQVVPHDVHDYDTSAPPVLFTSSSGQKLIGVGGKDGYVYAIDRATHKLAYKVQEARAKGHDLTPTVQGIPVCPIDLGGAEWNGPTQDQINHQLLTPMNDWCGVIKLGSTRYLPGQFFFGGAVTRDSYKTARGWLMAIDDATGKVAWRYHSPVPMLAGVTPTAGGVTFTGDMLGNFLVFDSKTGKVLYKDLTQGSVAGGVVTYAIGGKQYVATTSGNISRLTFGAAGVPTIIVYAL